VITRFPLIGLGRGGDDTVGGGALCRWFFCGVLNLTGLARSVRTGDALIARGLRGRGGDNDDDDDGIARVGAARMGGGRARASLTTVTPDAFMKF